MDENHKMFNQQKEIGEIGRTQRSAITQFRPVIEGAGAHIHWNSSARLNEALRQSVPWLHTLVSQNASFLPLPQVTGCLYVVRTHRLS
jgi:hypothetical protein